MGEGFATRLSSYGRLGAHWCGQLPFYKFADGGAFGTKRQMHKFLM